MILWVTELMNSNSVLLKANSKILSLMLVKTSAHYFRGHGRQFVHSSDEFKEKRSK